MHRLVIVTAMLALTVPAGCSRPVTPAGERDAAAPAAIPTTAPATRPATRPARLVVYVVARQFDWSFRYPEGRTSSELHAPAGTTVELHLTSADVIHALHIPALRINTDVLPKPETTVEFIAPKEGRYDVVCAEYCGVRHAEHVTKMVVDSDDGFHKWLRELPPPAAGNPTTRPGL